MSADLAMKGLYQSGWNPRGARKTWERCSMDAKSIARILPDYAKRDASVSEAVAWFSEEGSLRILVADMSDGRRIDYRENARGGWSMRFSPARQANEAGR